MTSTKIKLQTAVNAFKALVDTNQPRAPEKIHLAQRAFKSLNGIFCVFKPSGTSVTKVVEQLTFKLENQLNRMETRPQRSLVQLTPGTEATDHKPSVTVVPDIADHPLVVGPRYLADDFMLSYAGGLGLHSSGVLVMGIGRRRRLAYNISMSQPMAVYHVSGQLGKATDDFTLRGRTIEKATWGHVTPAKIDRMAAAMQAGHQKLMYTAAGVDIDSEEAYQLALKGLIRPKAEYPAPVIYSIKRIEFTPPHFTLEIHMIKENCKLLHKLVHELGLEMKTVAMCTQVRRISYGNFMLDDALLSKDWTAEYIIQNISQCIGHYDVSKPLNKT